MKIEIDDIKKKINESVFLNISFIENIKESVMGNRGETKELIRITGEIQANVIRFMMRQLAFSNSALFVLIRCFNNL
jgi:hypothetical protein